MRRLSLGTFSFTLLLVLVSGVAWAQTGDGQPPANESVCDVLIGATPGLYGLCVAFNEAHDCEPDPGLPDFVSHCKPGSPKILEAYNRKKQPGDPEMPGLVDGCPCFTSDELLDLSPYAECAIDQFDSAGNLYTQVVKDRSQFLLGNVIIMGNERSCFYNSGTGIRFFPVNVYEYAVCKERLLDAMELGSCP